MTTMFVGGCVFWENEFANCDDLTEFVAQNKFLAGLRWEMWRGWCGIVIAGPYYMQTHLMHTDFKGANVPGTCLMLSQVVSCKPDSFTWLLEVVTDFCQELKKIQKPVLSSHIPNIRIIQTWLGI